MKFFGPASGGAIYYNLLMSECIFCQIVAGQSPSHTVWENDEYQAFLSIFPNTKGVTVVIPKAHHSSYVFEVPEDVMHGLMSASREVSQLLEKTFPDIARVAVVFEGFGVDHLHAKLFPLHGTSPMEKWERRASNVDVYFDQYQGYVSSHDFQRADDKELKALAAEIRAHHQ